MRKRNHIPRRIKAIRRKSERLEVVRFARAASRNAKRSSIALDIPFEIIKDGGIYQVYEGNMIRTATLPKIKSDTVGLTKGSKICLK